MKSGLLKFLIVVLPLLAVGCSRSAAPTELSTVEALKSPIPTKINVIRLEMLKQTARGIGAQASLAWRSNQLNSMLIAKQRILERIFNFNYLTLNQNVMPPILLEGRNTLNLADDFTIRVSDHNYQIAQPPRFITTPPSWRDYLWMSYIKPETPNATLLPQNAAERKVWNEYIKIGWGDGILQADQIFSANLSRLQRDYQGMILYRKLLAKNMVTPPYVSKAELGVTGDGENIHVNDRILRITAIPQLQVNPKKWRPVMSIDQQQQMQDLILPKYI